MGKCNAVCGLEKEKMLEGKGEEAEEVKGKESTVVIKEREWC